jgi:ring-1,2-phenylacetyl-CoA epoxidase subunit PaaD
MVSTTVDARAVVASVVDPEIPVLTIEDLGILRSVDTEGDRVVVKITPTYSGCPAMRQIEDDIETALAREGFTDHEVVVVHNPAWSTDWISQRARDKLEEFGIAPPVPPEEILCPRCQQGEPKTVAAFGSTACKALMVCSSCGEPFDYFKELR